MGRGLIKNKYMTDFKTIKTIRDFDVSQKKVLVRCDFNADLDEKGGILDGYKIERTLPTINYLLERKAKIILMSHLGRPNGEPREKTSLKPIVKKLEEYLKKPVKLIPYCIGPKVEKAVKAMKPGEVILLENLRFHKEEEKNDLNFAKKLSEYGEIYICDAFAVSHRAHASLVGIPKFLPSGMGLLVESELNTLSQALGKKLPPLLTIIGGVKIETKIKLIEKLLKDSDHLILGGRIAYDILAGKGLCPSGNLPEEKTQKLIEKIDITNPRIHLPVDGVIILKNDGGGYLRCASLGQLRKEEAVLDIGPETIKVFSEIIKLARTVIWNGPLGKFEDERFAKGSLAVADAIIRSKAFSIVGGGDTSTFLRKYNLLKEFDFVSTGGGAMLAFLEGEKLPGIEALKIWK
ncbi:MAG: phosphoglycerate kinase [Candidatus Nealsonbacteria bacterium CG08_land_8_20_14_0_20_38_20]|uniref:Phosphoglycerate kinase n=1 Tax=Candidatus Nealsonbacteria bacterium CG08_land_8_20_14_0_20_38_20 TaxID=1974705 RepID=A0A2H0YLQ3_9BACT|nr:MAG: phosphoglycerate kinase [Candidatus Nealsonbacteria bacterium CG08_land_8_20_14_0_20_38_20]